jgi:hypothetical protein
VPVPWQPCRYYKCCFALGSHRNTDWYIPHYKAKAFAPSSCRLTVISMDTSYNALERDGEASTPAAGASIPVSRKPPGSIAPDNESVSAAVARLFCRCASSARVPLVQRWEMDPLRKWYHYNVFPRTLFLHVALVATVTAQIVLINGAVRMLHGMSGLTLLINDVCRRRNFRKTFITRGYNGYTQQTTATSWEIL